MKTEELNEHYTMNCQKDGQSSLNPNLRKKYIYVSYVSFLGTSRTSINFVRFIVLECILVYGSNILGISLKHFKDG